MLENKEGQKVPNVTFGTFKDNKWVNFTTDELFKGKKVILFALPGAFTPTCSSTHLPRYSQLSQTFKKNGVDDIICLSVNDTFVMNAWKNDQEAENITVIPDGNGEFSAGMGMLVDKSQIGFGKRSWRYSMLVNDGTIEKMFIEKEIEGDPFEVSDADTMLGYVAPNSTTPKSITMITKPGCGHCEKARTLLDSNGLQYEEIELGKDATSVSLTSLSGRNTTPQVFIDGKHIGGADDLEKYLPEL
jgi:glutaredoxin-like protein